MQRGFVLRVFGLSHSGIRPRKVEMRQKPGRIQPVVHDEPAFRLGGADAEVLGVDLKNTAGATVTMFRGRIDQIDIAPLDRKRLSALACR